MATNLKCYFVPIDPNYVSKDPNGNRGQELHGRRRESTHDHHSHRGSRWADSKVARRFRAQSAQFNTGTKSFRKRTCPLASQLISVIHKESCTSQLCNNRSNLAASAYQIAQHKQSAQFWISPQIGDFLQMQDYGQAPSTKSNNCVWVIMENFNSLGVFTKGTKINIEQTLPSIQHWHSGRMQDSGRLVSSFWGTTIQECNRHGYGDQEYCCSQS